MDKLFENKNSPVAGDLKVMIWDAMTPYDWNL